MVLVKCLHCDADNDPRQTSGYCESCGKKLPPASGFRSRHSGEAATLAETIREIVQPRRRTAEALFTAAVLWLICGGLFLVLGPVFRPSVEPLFAPVVMLTTVLGLAWYGALGLWARVQPRAAALTALVLFVLGWLGHLVVHPQTALLTLVYTPVLGLLVKAIVVSRHDRLE
jgi:hypothetical protein